MTNTTNLEEYSLKNATDFQEYSLGKKNQSTRNHSVLTLAPVRKTKIAATARRMANAERRLADTRRATAERAAERDAERDARRAADGLS